MTGLRIAAALATLALAATAGAAVAQVPPSQSLLAPSSPGLGGSASPSQSLITPQAPRLGSTVPTNRGPAVVNGAPGGVQTTTIPGSAGQGLLMRNSNGTGTVVTPGGVPSTVPASR